MFIVASFALNRCLLSKWYSLPSMHKLVTHKLVAIITAEAIHKLVATATACAIYKLAAVAVATAGAIGFTSRNKPTCGSSRMLCFLHPMSKSIRLLRHSLSISSQAKGGFADVLGCRKPAGFEFLLPCI